VGQLLEAGAEDATLSGMPLIVSDRVRFQYFAGLRFVSRALRNGGWSAVNRLYHSPPLSTEQILHPEKYFEAPDPPARIELKNLSRLFPSPWREIENDTLGELSVQCLFSQFLGPTYAAAVASGWGGDRFVAYQGRNEVALIWASTWDSAQDADEFFVGYQRIIPMKYQPLDRDRVYIEKRDRTVLIVEGLDRGYMQEFVENVWRDMEIQKGGLSAASARLRNEP
jgi:hypothetical protein